MTRFAVLNGFKGVILGRDLGGIFKEGHVYSVVEIMGTYMIEDLGEHATGDLHSIGEYATRALHCLTKEEYENQKHINQ